MESSNGSSTGPEPKDKETSPQRSGTTLSTWRETVELLSKATFAIVGLAFMVGLLITNIYVREYGLTYLGFLRTEYVMVGFLCLALLALSYFVVSVVVNRFEEFRTEIQKQSSSTKDLAKRLVINVFVALYLCLVPVVALSFLTGGLSGGKLFKGQWKSFGMLMVFAFVFHLCWKEISQWKKQISQRNTNFDPYIGGLYLLGSLFLAIAFLLYYATALYPTLQPAFGGGKSLRVSFVVKADQLEAIEPTGLKLSHGRVTEPVDVIFEAPDFFLIRTPDGFPDPKPKAVRFRKELVDTVFH
jgi:hypothetical protein